MKYSEGETSTNLNRKVRYRSNEREVADYVANHIHFTNTHRVRIFY